MAGLTLLTDLWKMEAVWKVLPEVRLLDWKRLSAGALSSDDIGQKRCGLKTRTCS